MYIGDRHTSSIHTVPGQTDSLITAVRHTDGETGQPRLCSVRSTNDLPAEQAQQLNLPREAPVCTHCGFAGRVDQTEWLERQPKRRLKTDHGTANRG